MLFFFLFFRQPPRSTLFPYTTLFRSRAAPARLPRPALDGPAAPAPHLARLGAEEGVAGPALAAHERLELERERRSRHLHERGERGVGVEHHFAHERDHPAALGPGQKRRAGVAHLRGSGVDGVCTVARVGSPVAIPPRYAHGVSSLPSSRRCRRPSPPRRTGTPRRRSTWRSARSRGARRPPPTRRCATTRPRRTASCSFSASSGRGWPIPRASSRPTSWSWKCTG